MPDQEVKMDDLGTSFLSCITNITKTFLFKYIVILPPKNENVQIKILKCFIFCSKHRL